MGKVIDTILDFFETTVCTVCFALMCCVILMQIVFRVAGWPLAWTEELARYLFVWIIYLSASKAVKLGRHLSVDLLPIILKGRARLALLILANLLCLGFFLVLAWYCVEVLQRMTVRPQYSAASGINMFIPYAAPAAGSIMMTLRCLRCILDDVQAMLRPPLAGAVEVTR